MPISVIEEGRSYDDAKKIGKSQAFKSFGDYWLGLSHKSATHSVAQDA